MSDAMETQLDAIFAAPNREDMRPTIDALLPIYDEHPENPRVLYELGGAYDTAGDEATALSFYQRAMERGLAGDVRRRCYLQYGSTLRNLGRIDDSLRAFARARAEFPESVALRAFEALTFFAAGRPNTALASLLVLLAEHVHAPELDRYKPALRGNADYLASLDAEDDAHSDAR
ncbi:tetratricopeptide repeat protein [Curtobacterium sp. MCPF17_050]|uniref:tetratricopeptide repeat protein n=1 Tax=Curtobacterium sp. MCPF17_050 TaxID=2175664 RepID=UPI000D96F4B7|nr:tetratricopeptide repeat protein [Curtobacterium sp. MCPF17_050]WIB14483.1 tetratricopeptide repeat protein [Curtobacterium sp. MCPF17_050]